MYEMVSEVRVPVTVPNVEVTCHNDCTFQIDNGLTHKIQGSLIAIRIDVNNEVDVTVKVEGQDIDVSMIDNVKTQSKSKL